MERNDRSELKLILVIRPGGDRGASISAASKHPSMILRQGDGYCGHYNIKEIDECLMRRIDEATTVYRRPD